MSVENKDAEKDIIFAQQGTIETYSKKKNGDYVLHLKFTDVSSSEIAILDNLSNKPDGVAVLITERDYTAEIAKLEEEGVDTTEYFD